MEKIILWVRLHSKILLWVCFLLTVIFYSQDNVLGRIAALVAKLYFFYGIWLIVKWLFGFQGVGQEENREDNLFPTSGAQGKVGKVRRGIRRAKRMRR